MIITLGEKDFNRRSRLLVTNWAFFAASDHLLATRLASAHKTVIITFLPDTCLKLFSDSHKFGSKLVCLVQPYAIFFQILNTIS
jgi:hypothetical protein